MSTQLPNWISIWLAVSTVLALWDSGYCLLRPRSMTGGDLSWIWKPYEYYAGVELLYGSPVFETGDGFPSAQSLLNVFEAILNVHYLYLRHLSPKQHAVLPLVGFAASLMTLWKTVLYFAQEYFCGGCRVGHNDWKTVIGVWLVPSGMWIVVPFIITVVLGKNIARSLARDSQREIGVPQMQEKDSGAKENIHHPSSVIAIGSTLPGSLSFPKPTGGVPLPITFRPRSLPVLVIGANRLAASRAFTFLEADADVVVSSTLPLADTAAEIQYRAKQSEIRYIQRESDVWTDFLSKHDFALVCVTDTLIGSGTSRRSFESASLISKACLKLHIPLNISDQPLLSTYTFPSVHRFNETSNLQIAVSTNGKGCRLNNRIKRELITRLPKNIGTAVDNVGRLRERAKLQIIEISDDDPDAVLNTPVEQLGTPSLLNIKNPFEKKGKEASASNSETETEQQQQLRRMRWVHQMSEYYSFEHLARMSVEEMDVALKTWSLKTENELALKRHDGEGSVKGVGKGRILLVGSGPGHPSLLTVAALHALKHSTLILSDKLVPSEIISLIPSSTKLHIAKKFPGNNEGAQNEMMELALEGARRGEVVVRLKQGDPFVYGRGGEEVLYFRENGFEAVVVPGVSSALAGPLMMNIPVTQRGVAESFILCTGVGRQGKSVKLPGYIRSRTLVVLMGVARIAQVVSVLTEGGQAGEGRDGAAFPPHLPIAIIERASSPDQRIILSTLEKIESALQSVEQRPPGMMIIGWAALCLEGKGRVDILDGDGGEEKAIVDAWLGEEDWKIREGLPRDWEEFLTSIDIES